MFNPDGFSYKFYKRVCQIKLYMKRKKELAYIMFVLK